MKTHYNYFEIFIIKTLKTNSYPPSQSPEIKHWIHQELIKLSIKIVVTLKQLNYSTNKIQQNDLREVEMWTDSNNFFINKLKIKFINFCKK